MLARCLRLYYSAIKSKQQQQQQDCDGAPFKCGGASRCTTPLFRSTCLRSLSFSCRSSGSSTSLLFPLSSRPVFTCFSGTAPRPVFTCSGGTAPTGPCNAINSSGYHRSICHSSNSRVLLTVQTDACAQLQCGRRDGQPYIPGSGCGTYFCAWCLGTSVDEGSCHDHVLECAMNPSNPK